jgi:hypothetical protein
MAKGILLAHTAPADGKQQEYDDWYNDVHLVDILGLAGFKSARRFKRIDGDEENAYLAIYEVEADDLHAAYAGLGAAAQNGDLRMSDVMAFDPPPAMALYEQVYEVEG